MAHNHVLQILLKDRPEHILNAFDDFAGALYLALSRAISDAAHFEPIQGIGSKYGILILNEIESDIHDKERAKKKPEYDPEAY